MNNKPVYAGFFIRLLAKLTDWTILFMPQAIFCYLISLLILGLSDLIIAIILYFTVFAFPGFIFTLLYNSLTTSKWGGTPGKLFAGLEVNDTQGRRLSISRSLFRHAVGYTVSALPLWLGFLWIIKDREHRGWHDQLSDTFVVHKTKKVPLLLVTLFFLLLSINLALAYHGWKNLSSNFGLRSDIERIEKLFKETLKEPSPYKSPPIHNRIS